MGRAAWFMLCALHASRPMHFIASCASHHMRHVTSHASRHSRHVRRITSLTSHATHHVTHIMCVASRASRHSCRVTCIVSSQESHQKYKIRYIVCERPIKNFPYACQENAVFWYVSHFYALIISNFADSVINIILTGKKKLCFNVIQ